MLTEFILSAFMSISSPDSNKYNPLRPIEYTDTLKINTQNNIRYTCKKGELEGMIDLIELSKSSSLEEAYAYIPDDTLWIEIGYNETGWTQDYDMENKKVMVNKVLLDTLILNSLPNNKSVTIHHLHPYKDPLMFRYPTKNIITYCIYNACLPSDKDVITMHKYNKFIFKIESYLGVTEFGLSKNGKYMSEDAFNNYMKKYEDSFVTSKEESQDIEEMALKKIHSTLSRWFEDAVYITFTPLRIMTIQEK